MIALPESPEPTGCVIRTRDFGATIEGGRGGADQRRNTPGNRWEIVVSLPRMDIALAREWSMLLTMGLEAGGVRFWVRQLGLDVGAPGSPIVSGAGQACKTLNGAGFTRGYRGLVSQYFSVVTGGRRYGYKLAARSKASAAGEAALTFEPALRAEPAGGDVLEFGKPFIEGLLASVPEEVSAVSSLAEGFEFVIREAR